MSRTAVEMIKTHKELNGRNVQDPINADAKIGAYTVVANGVLLSSYLPGTVGKYAKFIVGKGSDHSEDEEDHETEHDLPSYFRWVMIFTILFMIYVYFTLDWIL